MAPPLFPVVLVLLQRNPHAGIELVEDEGAGSDRLRPVLEPVRNHEDVIVGQGVGQVRVRPVQRNLNLVFVELLDVGHRLEGARAARLGVAAMQVQRIDRVVRGEFLAVGELDAFAKVEDPVFGAVRRLEALGELGMRFAVIAPLDDAAEQPVAGVDHDRVVVGRDVDAVGRAASAKAEPEHAAILRRLAAARRRSASMVEIAALEAPRAAARPMNSRREIAPLSRRPFQKSSSFILRFPLCECARPHKSRPLECERPALSTCRQISVSVN